NLNPAGEYNPDRHRMEVLPVAHGDGESREQEGCGHNPANRLKNENEDDEHHDGSGQGPAAGNVRRKARFAAVFTEWGDVTGFIARRRLAQRVDDEQRNQNIGQNYENGWVKFRPRLRG